jgi:uncharacterized Tic20 family protein
MSTFDTPTPPRIDSNDRLWITISHLSLFFGAGILLPLIIYLVKKADSPVVASQSREALNFHISVYLYVVLAAALSVVFIGIPLLFVIGIGSLILSVLAAVKSVDGNEYRYPLTIRFVS